MKLGFICPNLSGHLNPMTALARHLQARNHEVVFLYSIPVTYGQPGVAARIANKQTGVVTSLDKLTAKHLSKLLNEVLSNPTYRNNARKLQKAIAKANGLSVAADLVDGAHGATDPAAIETDGDGWKAWAW